jgi:hypothetical protein
MARTSAAIFGLLTASGATMYVMRRLANWNEATPGEQMRGEALQEGSRVSCCADVM